ncbi:MAG: DUF4091 domain-containing protein, partial [Planctomycetota bacterium]
VRADRNGIIVDGSARFGVDAVASLRLKAMRRGIQDIEYIVALARRRGWAREQVRHALTGHDGWGDAVDELDRWDLDHLAGLRETLLEMLSGE